MLANHGDSKQHDQNQEELDPVGSIVRYEVMKLCTESVWHSNGLVVLIQYRAVLVLVLGGAGSVLGNNCKFLIRLHILKNVEIWSGVTNPDHSSCLESLYREWLSHELFRL